MDDGIYFGLPEEEYHADPALSSSGIKKLLVSPLTYWAHSPMNPDYDEPRSPAMEEGKAFHKRLLEGREAFEQTFAVKPDKADYPDAIDGGAALRERCAELGVAKGGTIAALCERILDADPDACLWPVIEQSFREEADGLSFISPDLAARIERSVSFIEANPSAVKALANGMPEVSIFWTDDDTGVALRCRADYLKTKAIVDLKTFSNSRGLPLHRAVAHAVANERYHVPGVVYSHGVHAVKDLIRTKGDAVVHGDVDETWLKAFLACPEHTFVFLFVESGAAPNVVVREFARKTDHETNQYFTAGWMAFRMGVELFRDYRQRYGDKPWIDPQPMVRFSDYDFPLYMME